MKEYFPFPLNTNDKEEVKKKLEIAKRHLSDLQYDDKNGTYPGGVPVDVFDKAKNDIEELERLLYELENPLE